MTTIGIRDLRASLATQVARAAAGDDIVIRVNGKAIASLGPLGATTTPDSCTWDRLIASGGLVAPRRHDGRTASGAVRVWRNVRLDLLLREVRG